MCLWEKYERNYQDIYLEFAGFTGVLYKARNLIDFEICEIPWKNKFVSPAEKAANHPITRLYIAFSCVQYILRAMEGIMS